MPFILSESCVLFALSALGHNFFFPLHLKHKFIMKLLGCDPENAGREKQTSPSLEKGIKYMKSLKTPI